MQEKVWMGNDPKSKESYCVERGHSASKVWGFDSEIKICNSLRKNYFKSKCIEGIIYTNTQIRQILRHSW